MTDEEVKVPLQSFALKDLSEVLAGKYANADYVHGVFFASPN